jgi:hypothetical protein
MTIKVSKPSINLREKLNELEQDTGLKGQELMRADTVAEARTLIGAGRKNLIINGAMQVSQRGTSSTNVSGTGYFACDRVKFWSASSTSDVRWTVSQDTNAPEGFGSSYKLDCTTADATPDASYYGLLRVGLTEGQDMLSTKFGTSSAETLTLSFWVKSNITGSQQVLFVSHDSQKHAGNTFTITSVDTWEKKVITISGDANPANGFSNDNSLGFSIDMLVDAGSNYTGGTALSDSWVSRVNADKAVNNLSLGASTSNYFQITGVQLELGSVATEFEHRSYGEELALCQRYYQIGAARLRIYPMSTTNGWITMLQDVNFKVTMRTSPSVTYGNESSGHSTDSVTNEYVRVKRYYNSYTNERNIHTTLKADAEL